MKPSLETPANVITATDSERQHLTLSEAHKAYRLREFLSDIAEGACILEMIEAGPLPEPKKEEAA